MHSQRTDSADDQLKWLRRLWHRRYLGLPLIIWVSAVLIAILLWVAVSIPNPTESQSAIIRFLIAVSGAVVSTVLFGHLTLKGPLQRFNISATGPMAVFVFLQFVSNPIRLVSRSAPTGQIAAAMAARPCAEEGRLRSIHGETQSAVFFRNDGKDAVRLYWLDYDGIRRSYGTLDPHESTTQPTFLTHPWLVADAMDQCIVIYLPETQTPAVIIH